MAIKIDRLTPADSGRKVRVFFSDGHREAELRGFSREAELLIVHHEGQGMAFYSPELVDFT